MRASAVGINLSQSPARPLTRGHPSPAFVQPSTPSVSRRIRDVSPGALPNVRVGSEVCLLFDAPRRSLFPKPNEALPQTDEL